VNLHERNLRRVQRWIDAIDKERDALARTLDGTRLVTDVHRAFVMVRLGKLEEEKADVVALLRRLESDRYQPALMFSARPVLRMLSVPLRRNQERKRA
jgi:hypothetical protein